MAMAENEEGTEEEVIEDEESQEEGKKPESGETEEKPDSEESPDGDDNEVHVGFGDDPPPSEKQDSKSDEAFARLRRENSENKRRLREFEQERAQREQQAKATEVGPEPQLEDFDFDTAAYKKELLAWTERQRAAEEEGKARQAAAEKQQQAWKTKLDGFSQQKASLKVSDYAAAEDEVTGALNQQQLAIVIQAAKNSGHLVYALGKAPNELKRLQAISDPIEFAAAVGALETKLKVTDRKAVPSPDQPVRGGAQGGSKAAETHLARLEKEADRSGDRSKLIAYKRQLREKAT